MIYALSKCIQANWDPVQYISKSMRSCTIHKSIVWDVIFPCNTFNDEIKNKEANF